MPNSNLLDRAGYSVFYPVTTRWSDNDIYGHINNVVYYSYFDSVVNRFLIEQGGLKIHESSIVAYVVYSKCHYVSPLAYPDAIEVGLRVEKLGNSSVTYQLAVFKIGEEKATTCGSFVHVFVDRNTDKSTGIPSPIRLALQSILVVEKANENL